MHPRQPAHWLKWIDRLGINALFRLLNRRRPLVLWYHGICADEFTLLRGYDVRQLPVSLFRRQLQHLRERGYRFVSMDELLAEMDAGRGKRLVTLSIDDGFRNVITRGYPLMREFGARGTLYVVTDLVGSDALLWTDQVETVIRNAPRGEFRFRYRGEILCYPLTDEPSNRRAMRTIKRLLRNLSNRERMEHLEQFVESELTDVPEEFALADWSQLRSLDPGVLEVGNHTRTHPNCTQLESDEELEREIWQAGLDLEEKLGYPVRHFCYPAGSYDARVLERVQRYGYRSAVTTEEGFTDFCSSPFELRRIEAEDEWYLFLARTSGAYEFFTGLKARARAILGRPAPAPEPLPLPALSGSAESAESRAAARD